MNATDQLKCLKKGMRIIRPTIDYSRQIGNPHAAKRFVIKAKTLSKPNWYIYMEGFNSEAAMLRQSKELLKSQQIIQD